MRSYRRQRYTYYPERRYRRGFSCFSIVLFALGASLVMFLFVTLFTVLRPYFPIIGVVLLGILALLTLAGIVWIGLFLYGMLQDQLKKKEERDIVRVPKNERLVIRRGRKRTLEPLIEEGPMIIDAPLRSRQAALALSDPFVEAQLPLASSRTPAVSASSPQVIYYANIRGSLRAGQVLRGVDPDTGQLHMGTWSDDFKTLLVLGEMASSKTNTIAEMTAQAAQGGALLVVCDPHAHKADSLYRRVAPLAHLLFPGATMAIEHEDILANVRLVRDELERRVRGGQYSQPLFLILDECNRLLDDEEIADELLCILRQLGREGRGYHMYVICGVQQVTYYSEFRKSFTSKIVHRCDKSEAELVIPQRFAKFAPELPNGMAYVKTSGVIELLQQALITKRDIELIASEYADHRISRSTPGSASRSTRKLTRDLVPNMRPVVNAPKQDERPVEQRLVRLLSEGETTFQTQKKMSQSKVNVSEPLRQEIIRLAQSGMSRRKIKDQLGLHGAKYEIVRQVLDEIGL